MSTRTREIIGKAILETLEHRQMLSTVTLTDGVLVVQGNSHSPNTIGVHGDHGKVWAVTDKGSSQKIAASSVRQIRIMGGEKADDVSVDASVRIPVYIQTGDGNDTIQAGGGRDTVVSGNGDDNVRVNGGHDFVKTGNGADVVNGGGGHDQIHGGNGADTINTGGGSDVVIAGGGNDSVYSGAGRDKIWLGTGDNSANVKTRDRVHSTRSDNVHRRHKTVVGNVGADLPTPGGSDTGSIGSDPSNSGSDNSGSGTTGSGSTGTDTGSGSTGADSGSNGSDNGGTTTPVASASSFTLINADTGKAISGFENITGTVSIDLTTLPTTNLNIRANYASAIGSVVFGYDGNSTDSVESKAPYSFAHDTGSFTPTVGNHTITATAFSGDAGQGAAGATVTLNLVVSQSAVNPTPTPDPTPDPTPNPTPDPAPTPTPTPGSDAPVAVIQVMESSVQVDHAIHVNGISSNTVAGTLLTAKFIWDFGDPGSNYNQLVGWNAAHLYTQPGKYTIKLTITNEDGKTSVASTTVNILASTRKVIYVSNDGSDSNSGLSPQSALKSFAKAMGMIGDNTEVLFHSGDKFDVPAGAHVSNSNVVIGSYGNGAKPILSYSGPKNYSAIITTTGKAQDVTIENVTFDSVFTNNYEKTGMPDAIAAGGKNISAYGCTILNIGYGMNTNQKPTGVLMQECDAPDVHGIRSYMIYAQGSDFVIIGNTVANSTREHCLRVDGADRILIEDNDLTNQDRRPEGDSLDTDKQTITVHHGSYAFVYGNTTHGGRVEIGPLGEADGLKPSNLAIGKLSYVVIEANDFNFLPNDRVEIDHGTTHVMVCDNKISVTSGAAIAIQAMGMYTSWPGYGTRHVEDVIIAGDNSISGASQNVSVGKGSVGIKVLPGGSPVYSMGYKAAA